MDEPFRICMECGRVWKTAEEFLAAFNALIAMDNREPVSLEKAVDHDFCPDCLHDFW